MFAEWNDRALAAVERQPEVPDGKGLYSYQTLASFVGMVYQGMKKEMNKMAEISGNCHPFKPNQTNM